MIHSLASWRLPEDGPLRRDLPPRAENPAHPGWHLYDDRTLVYEAVAMPGRVVKLCVMTSTGSEQVNVDVLPLPVHFISITTYSPAF